MPAVIALVAGGLLPLALAPFDLWPLAFVSLALWFYVLETSPGRGMLLGWLFGVGKFAVGVSWVYVSIHEHGNAPPLLAGFLIALFVAALALFSLANGWLFRRFRPSGWPWAACWFVILICAFEWLLTWFLSGFPWLYPGYGLLDTSLRGFAPLGGVHLVSFVVAASSCAAVLVARHLARADDVSRRVAVGAALVIVLPWPVGAGLSQVSWTQPVSRHEAALVQGNIDQVNKWQPANRVPIVATYMRLSEPHWGVHLLLWPEAAITIFEHDAGQVLRVLDERGQVARTGLILGIPALHEQPDGRVVFQNAAIGLGTATGRYVKRHLVPFGEYVPLEGVLRGLIDFFDLPMSRAAPGANEQPPLRVAGAPYPVAICYEVVYPELVRSSPSAVLVTISNDTWFGESIGPHQHLQMARMRALENGRWLLRGTNSGVTAIVDPGGAVRGRLPQFEEGVLLGSYELMDGQTPFARFGSWPLWALLSVVGIMLARLRLGQE